MPELIRKEREKASAKASDTRDELLHRGRVRRRNLSHRIKPTLNGEPYSIIDPPLDGCPEQRYVRANITDTSAIATVQEVKAAVRKIDKKERILHTLAPTRRVVVLPRSSGDDVIGTRLGKPEDSSSGIDRVHPALVKVERGPRVGRPRKRMTMHSKSPPRRQAQEQCLQYSFDF